MGFNAIYSAKSKGMNMLGIVTGCTLHLQNVLKSYDGIFMHAFPCTNNLPKFSQDVLYI